MTDRNFDDLAERFEQRIYGKLKGKIRQHVIWNDLNDIIPAIKNQTPLRILDLGAGLGQFTIALAEQGHYVAYNDISTVMFKKTQLVAKEKSLINKIEWSHAPYQQFIRNNKQCFDIILCHALLEWLDEPQQLIRLIKPLIKPNGFLSLCFYNPKGLVYRNLMRGNFHYLNHGSTPQYHSQGLTPSKPCHYEDVKQWLAKESLVIKSRSGIRVFSDYAREKRGGLESEESILNMELEYSRQEPYWRLGRYLHFIATSTN